MFTDFTKREFEDWSRSDNYSNESMFNCMWRESNAVLDDTNLKLSIDKEPEGGRFKYNGGEVRTGTIYSFGLFEVSMKAIKNIGVVSSFFTYIGPSMNQPWDEIDIEFLGKDTTKVQFNYYTNGVGGHEFMYDLGFDASEDFHTYGFKWEEGQLTWYVDGKQVHQAYMKIPTIPGHIYMNTWNGVGVDEWLGAYDGNTRLTAEYEWVRYTPLHLCED